MKGIFSLMAIFILPNISFAQDIEGALKQIGPVPFLAAGTGGLIFFGALVLSYIAISYGIQLLSKKYEPSIHPAWSWIPVAHIYPLVLIAKQPLWLIAVVLLGGFVPVFGPIISLAALIFIYHKISVRCGRGAGTTALLTFFSVITFPWLGLTVNKKNIKVAWIIGVAAIFLAIIGVVLAGIGAVGGILKLNKTHRFMDRAREEVIKEIQSNPSIREQLKDLEIKTDKADVSKTEEL